MGAEGERSRRVFAQLLRAFMRIAAAMGPSGFCQRRRAENFRIQRPETQALCQKGWALGLDSRLSCRYALITLCVRRFSDSSGRRNTFKIPATSAGPANCLGIKLKALGQEEKKVAFKGASKEQEPEYEARSIFLGAFGEYAQAANFTPRRTVAGPRTKTKPRTKCQCRREPFSNTNGLFLPPSSGQQPLKRNEYLGRLCNLVCNKLGSMNRSTAYIELAAHSNR